MEEDNKETLLENETGDVVPNEAIDENIDGMVGDDEEVISPIDSNSHLTADKTKSNVNNKLSVLFSVNRKPKSNDCKNHTTIDELKIITPIFSKKSLDWSLKCKYKFLGDGTV